MFLLGILLLAANLRAAITVVGPLLQTIRGDYGLSGVEAGALTALPVLGFAVFSPYAPRLSRRLGIEATPLLALLVLIGGIALRSAPSAVALYAGTVVLSAGIAVANVVLPALVKQCFPRRQSTVTGMYATAMALTAAVASGVAVPLAGAGWRTALGVWAGLAIVGVLVWAPRVERPRTSAPPDRPIRLPWRSAVAWKVTAFMGLQSLGFYVMIGWLPSLLESRGITARAAGWELFGYQVVSLAAMLGLPLILDRRSDHRALALAAATCCGIGYVGLAVAPGVSLVWVLLAGLGAGATLVLALSFMALRAGAPDQAVALSAMAQSVGYLLAAAGPFLFGVLHDVSGGWTEPLVMLIASAAILAAVALGAGRARLSEP